MTAKIAPQPWLQFYDGSGSPLSGGTLRTFSAGTTTPLATYNSVSGGVANPVSIPLNTAGIPSNATVPIEVCLLDGNAYKFEIWSGGTTPALVASYDDLRGVNDFVAANIAEWYTSSYTGTGTLEYVSGTSFAVLTGAGDISSTYHIGRRIKIYDGAVTHYGTISASTYNGGTLKQTIGCTDMAAVLSGAFSGTPTLAYGILSSINPAIPKVVMPDGSTATTQAAGTSDTRLATTAFVTTANAAASVAPSIQNFRLSLTTAVPVTTSDVASSTSVFVVPYIGKKIGLYYGSAWVIVTSAEVTLALGTITSDLGYDVFCYTTDGTTLSVELLAWTSTIARATALAYQDGVLVKATDSTRRYMGSFLTISTTTTCDTEAKRYLWNNYHRVTRSLKYPITTASWTVPAAAWRQAGADTANQVMLFAGLIEDSVNCTYMATHSHSSSGILWHTAVGLNTTAAPTGYNATGGSVTAGAKLSTAPTITTLPILGKNYLAALEYAVSITTTGYSTTALSVSGLYGNCRA